MNYEVNIMEKTLNLKIPIGTELDFHNDKIIEITINFLHNIIDEEIELVYSYENNKVICSFTLNEFVSKYINRINYERNFDIVQYVLNNKDNEGDVEQADRTICIDLTLQSNLATNFNNSYIALSLLHMFFIVNISLPGLVDLKKDNFTPTPLHAISLGEAWTFNNELGLELINFIELSSTVKWFNSLNLNTKQIATNNTERAIFAIFHIVDSFHLSSSSVLWISQALESLYDVPKGLILNTLVNRIILFLEIPNDKQKITKKALNMFYEYRSRFVHGDLNISLPLNNDILDDNFDSYFDDLLNILRIGLFFLVATFQKMIRDDIKEIKFKEINISK